MCHDGGAPWEAYELKEALREIFAGDLAPADVLDMIDRWSDVAAGSGFSSFRKAAATTAPMRGQAPKPEKTPPAFTSGEPQSTLKSKFPVASSK